MAKEDCAEIKEDKIYARSYILFAFPYVGINRIRFKGTLSILFQNTPKAKTKVKGKARNAKFCNTMCCREWPAKPVSDKEIIQKQV